MEFQIWLRIPLLLLIIASGITWAEFPEKKLLKTLLEGYDYRARPVANANQAVRVTFGMKLRGLLTVNEAGNSIRTNTRLIFMWKDENLRWDPKEYEGLTAIRIPVWSIWRPDVHNLNGEHDWFDPSYPVRAIVEPNGTVVYVPPAIYTSGCQLKFEFYPLDQQQCDLTFGSWSHGLSRDINLQLFAWQADSGGDMSILKENSEWTVTAFPAIREAYKVTDVDEVVTIKFTLNFKRRGELILRGFRVMNVFISLLVLLSFALPPVSVLKLLLGFVAIICDMWVTYSINSTLSTNHNSNIGWYFEKLGELVLASIITNLVIVSVFHCKLPMPEIIRKLLDGLPTRLNIICPDRGDAYARMGIPASTAQKTGPQLNDTEHLVVGGSTAMQPTDWMYLACLLDRLFLIVYAMCIFIYMVALSPSFPTSQI